MWKFFKFQCRINSMFWFNERYVIWHKGREAIQQNDKYIFCTYISPLGRYNDTCSPVECWKTTVLAHARLKNRLFWIHNKRFMEPWFGVTAGGTAGPLQTKKEVTFGEFNPHVNAAASHLRIETTATFNF